MRSEGAARQPLFSHRAETLLSTQINRTKFRPLAIVAVLARARLGGKSTVLESHYGTFNSKVLKFSLVAILEAAVAQDRRTSLSDNWG